MWLRWAGSCQNNDSSSTLWITTNLENLLLHLLALHSARKKTQMWEEEFQTSENGWWLIRRGRRELQELRKRSLQTLFLSAVHPDVPQELFCHDSPVRAALSRPTGTWCHFLGSTSDVGKLPSSARKRDGPTADAAYRKSFINAELISGLRLHTLKW